MSQKRAMKKEDFKKINIFSDPVVTPDGTGFSFVMNKPVDDDSYKSNIYFQELTGDKICTQWTFGIHKNSTPRFSPDGNQVIFMSDRTGKAQLWLMELSGGEARQLTTFKNGVANPVWTPDSEKIIFTASLEKDDDVREQKEQTKEEKQKEQETKRKQAIVIDRLQYKAEGAGIRDGKRTQIISYDVKKETLTQLTTAETDHSLQDISPDGKHLLFIANLDGNEDDTLKDDLYELDLLNTNIKKLTKKQNFYNSARYDPNGEKIVLFGDEGSHRGATQTEIYLLKRDGAFIKTLSEEWDFQVGDVLIGDMRLGEAETGPVWSKDGREIYFIRSENGATQLCAVDMTGKLALLYSENNHLFGFSYNRTTETFIIGISDPQLPCDLYLLHKDGKKERLTNVNKSFLEEVAVMEAEEIVYKAEDDVQIQGWMLKPYGFEPGKKYPLILEIHGGPHMMYGQTFFHELQVLAAQGYAVLYINPRGSYGYGQAFVDGCREDYGGQDYRDLMHAVDYVLENYDFIDENRLGVTGGSYGGFMTNWIVGHTDRFKAAVTQRSISNWLSFYGVSDIGYFFNEWEHELDLLEDTEALWDISPLKYANNVTTPLLIMHGEEDRRCPIEQGEQLYVALKHRKKETEFVRFPGAGHDLSRGGAPVMRIERLKYMLRWFEKYLNA